MDRALANCRWTELFPASFCEYLTFEGSDHRPLLTYLDKSQKKKKNLFGYDRRLTNRACKETIQTLQQDLDIALSSPVPDTDRIGMLTSELDKAYWRQRSRILWLQHGDKNTSYFHAITRGRTAANKFAVIENQQGTPVYEEGQIAATIARYYSDLFTEASNGDPQIIAEAIRPTVSESMNELLTSIPDDFEIKNAVFAIHGDKAPGPDGFSANFYQGFWDIIGHEVC